MSNVEPRLSANVSIFDDEQFETVDECVEYMAKMFGFFIPDSEYLSDLEGLLEHLGEKVKRGQRCIYCQKIFPSGKAAQNHMIDKSHCKIRYESDVDGEELQTFYDFSSVQAEPDEGGVTISPTGEATLPDGRVLEPRKGARSKQHYIVSEAVAGEAVLAAQKEELLRLASKVGSMRLSVEAVDRMDEQEVLLRLLQLQKEARQGTGIEQRARRARDNTAQKKEYRSAVQKARTADIVNAQVGGYHGQLM